MNITVDKTITEKKLLYLKKILSSMESACVAFSGGVDSAFVLKVSKDVLGEKMIAVTATSPIYPEHELKEAKALATSIDVRHIVIDSNELEIPGFSENRQDRCYYCKSNLFGKLRLIAEEHGIHNVIDGTNYDDMKDYRPGRKAAEELGVRSPLCEAGLTKEEIRYLSRKLRVSTWDKPSLACLSSRFPYGEEITEEKLKKVEEAENMLRGMGFTQFRVRHHNGLARVEFIPEEMTLFSDVELRLRVYNDIKKIGFQYITVDLQGYRTGSMNEVLES